MRLAARGVPLFNAVQVPEVGRKLARFLQVKQGSVTPTVAPDLYPVVIVGNLERESADDIEVERPMIDSIIITSLGTDIAVTWHFGNPPGSSCLFIVEHLMCSANITARWDVVLNSNQPGGIAGMTLGTPKPRNTQTTGATALTGNSAALWGAKGNAIAGGGNFSSRYILANTSEDLLAEPFVLTPGFAIRVQRSGAIAGEQQLTPIWRERRLVA